MRRLVITTVVALLIVNLWISASAQNQQAGREGREESLQKKVDSLQVGVSSLDSIEKLFGKPEKIRRALERHDKPTMVDRPVVLAEYPSKGLSFVLMAQPSELYSITTSSKDISVHGIRIGDSLQQVAEKLKPEGEWRTTEDQDWWWLDFKQHGVKFGFARDKNQEKLPRSLAKPELVVRIEVYNSKVSFY
jgi:hypothetical protein